MKIRLTPLSGVSAAIWAVSWFIAAALLTVIFWNAFISQVAFLAFFAAVAITAARSGAWWGMGSAVMATVVMSLSGVFPKEVILIRVLAMLANSSLVIWLGTMLRRGASENQAYQESIGDAVPDFVWSCDPLGAPRYVNTRTLEFFGVYLDEFERDGWTHFTHIEDTTGHGKNFPPKIIADEFCDFECRFRRRDGTYCWFASRAVPIKNDRGEIINWVGTSTNIDRRKRVEMEREQLLARESQARSDAERASRMKDEFLATVSHELRTPLNAIVGWIYLLKNGKVAPEELNEGLTAIERNTRVQSQLIEDLLDMSRIISGQIRLDMQFIDLPLVIDAAIESVDPSAEAKQISITTEIAPLATSLRGDSARLQQVVWNLLSNAIKFTPKGGSVKIAAACVDSQVEICITDTGEGIAAAFLPHLFERFRQADASTTRRHSGLGLGLAIVKQLIELHGGTIEAQSPGEGQGSTFRILLPLPAVHIDEKGRPAQTAAVSVKGTTVNINETKLKGVKLLVVDDEKDSRDVIQRILQACGAQVTVADSSEQALLHLREQHFHTLISDIGMPGMDGFELIKNIRTTSNIPAIALTAFARSEDRRHVIQSGFDMFIPKPADPGELIAAAERCAARATREMHVPAEH